MWYDTGNHKLQKLPKICRIRHKEENVHRDHERHAAVQLSKIQLALLFLIGTIYCAKALSNST